MRWTTSSVITLIAVIATAISPIANAIIGWFRVKEENERAKRSEKIAAQREELEDMKTHFRKYFYEYLFLTYKELKDHEQKAEFGFSSEHKYSEAKVRMYANAELIDKIDELNKGLDRGGTWTFDYQSALNDIVQAFNLQWQTLQPKID